MTGFDATSRRLTKSWLRNGGPADVADMDEPALSDRVLYAVHFVTDWLACKGATFLRRVRWSCWLKSAEIYHPQPMKASEDAT